MSNIISLVATLFGFFLMLIGILLGFTATLKMINVLNEHRATENKIPRWHAFIRFYSNEAIDLYRASNTGGLPTLLLQLCWLFMGAGFVMVIAMHFIDK